MRQSSHESWWGNRTTPYSLDVYPIDTYPKNKNRLDIHSAHIDHMMPYTPGHKSPHKSHYSPDIEYSRIYMRRVG